MKKIFILLIAAFCVIAVAGIASAVETVTDGTGNIGSNANSTLSITTSSNVRVVYTAASQTYGAKGEHEAGNRAYGTGSATPGIYYKVKEAGTWNTDTVGSDFTGSGWDAQ